MFEFLYNPKNLVHTVVNFLVVLLPIPICVFFFLGRNTILYISDLFILLVTLGLIIGLFKYNKFSFINFIRAIPALVLIYIAQSAIVVEFLMNDDRITIIHLFSIVPFGVGPFEMFYLNNILIFTSIALLVKVHNNFILDIFLKILAGIIIVIMYLTIIGYAMSGGF